MDSTSKYSNFPPGPLRGVYNRLEPIDQRVREFDLQFHQYNDPLESANSEDLAANSRMIDVKSQLKQDLKDERENHQRITNSLSTTSLRPLTILDLPQEILLTISEHVKTQKPKSSHFSSSENKESINDIKSLRLTCWQLHNTSSHLLLNLIRVGLDQASLQDLQEIARHPLIGKGVVAVRVLLDFYDEGLAKELETFAAYNARRVRRDTENIEQIVGTGHYFSMPEATVLENIGKMKGISASWECFAERDRDDSENIEISWEHVLLLQRAHEEYQMGFLEQEELLRNDIFVKSVADSLAKMPCLKRMEIVDGDENYRKHPGIYALRVDEDEFVHSLLDHHGWEDAGLERLGPPPAAIVVKILKALYQQRVFLTHLDIKVSLLEDLKLLAPSKDDLPDLTAAMQRLRDFDFRPYRSSNKGIRARHVHYPSEIQALCRFIIAVLDTPSLETVRMDFRCLWDADDRPLGSMGSIVTSRMWPNLRTMDLHHVWIQLADMKTLLCQTQHPHLISWSNTYLMSGVWTEAFDVLRERCRGAEWVCFKNPMGVEFGGLSAEEREELLEEPKGGGVVGGEYNLAEKYILGYTDKNPVMLVKSRTMRARNDQ